MKLKVLLPLSLVTLMFACAPSTQVTKSWKDPSVTPETVKPFKKVLVIARINDQTSNRIAEDKLVASFKQGVAFPSYSILSPTDTVESKVETKLKEQGFDGLLVMKLTNVNKTLDYQPGTGYAGFYGARFGEPGSLSVDQTFYAETSIYSLSPGKLLWSGTTSTLNPTQLDKSIDDVIAAIKAELVKEGLMKAPEVSN
jgi:hypothetical protein